MTFSEAKSELNVLLNIRREIMPLEAIKADICSQMLKSPKLDNIVYSSNASVKDEKLAAKIDKPNAVDKQLLTLRTVEAIYVVRLQQSRAY